VRAYNSRAATNDVEREHAQPWSETSTQLAVCQDVHDVCILAIPITDLDYAQNTYATQTCMDLQGWQYLVYFFLCEHCVWSDPSLSSLRWAVSASAISAVPMVRLDSRSGKTVTAAATLYWMS